MPQIALMYHDIIRDSPSESGFQRERDLPYKVDEAQFREQISAITEYCKTKGKPLDSIKFTFDDGGKSFYSIIAPILEEFGYKGTFFISTGYIGTPSFLSEDEIRNLHERGHEIGTHAVSHQHLYTLTDEQVDEEWTQSIETLRSITGAAIENASIPNGDITSGSIESLFRNGIKQVYTSEPSTKEEYYHEMRLRGRFVITKGMSTHQVMRIVSSPVRRCTLHFKYSIIQIIKRLLGDNYIKIKYSLAR